MHICNVNRLSKFDIGGIGTVTFSSCYFNSEDKTKDSRSGLPDTDMQSLAICHACGCLMIHCQKPRNRPYIQLRYIVKKTLHVGLLVLTLRSKLCCIVNETLHVSLLVLAQRGKTKLLP